MRIMWCVCIWKNRSLEMTFGGRGFRIIGFQINEFSLYRAFGIALLVASSVFVCLEYCAMGVPMACMLLI